jgi:hypothetical protein
MNSFRLIFAAVASAVALGSTAPAVAASFTGPVSVDASMVTPVADGCGINGWRGPGGHCHYGAGRWGNPGWYYGGRAFNGCPPGYWRGPWGHCRNTPYHGPLPNGGWR